jgi:high-affinity K+ transport system ATPase subunit B
VGVVTLISLLVARSRRRSAFADAIGIAGMDRVAQFNVIATSLTNYPLLSR